MTKPCLRRFIPILAALLLLAGCAKGSVPAPAPVPPSTTLRITVAQDVPNPALDLLISAYQERRPNVRVVKVPVTVMYGESGIKELEPLVFGGRVDLFDVTVLLGRWNREGKQPAADLTPFVLKSRLDTRSYAPVWDELYKDGRLLALPVKVNPMFVVANDKLVREAGVTLPEGAWTWDQFREAVAKLTHGAGDDKIWGFHAGRRAEFLAPAWVTGALQPQVGKTEEQAVRDVLRFLSGLIDDGFMPRNAKFDSTPWPPYFENGKAAITLMPINPLFDPAPDWKVLAMPSHPGARPVTAVSTNSYAIAEASPNKEAAWDMLSFMAGPEGALVVAKIGFVPYQLTPEAKAAFLEAHPSLPAGMAAALDSSWTTFPSFADPTTRTGLLWDATFDTLAGSYWTEAASFYESRITKLN